MINHTSGLNMKVFWWEAFWITCFRCSMSCIELLAVNFSLTRQSHSSLNLASLLKSAPPLSTTIEFLEERHPWSKKEEKRVFIVPVQLPEDKGEKRLSFLSKRCVWSIHFVFPDGFISLTLFHHLVTACINWNGKRKQNIAW